MPSKMVESITIETEEGPVTLTKGNSHGWPLVLLEIWAFLFSRPPPGPLTVSHVLLMRRRAPFMCAKAGDPLQPRWKVGGKVGERAFRHLQSRLSLTPPPQPLKIHRTWGVHNALDVYTMCARTLPFWRKVRTEAESWELAQEAFFADMQTTGTTGAARKLSDLTTVQLERALCRVLQQCSSNADRYNTFNRSLDKLCAEEEEKARIATWYEGDSPNPLARLRRPTGCANLRRR